MGKRYGSAAYRELGGMLSGVRRGAGLSASDLARELGWPLATIWRMDNGQRTSTVPDVIQYVAVCGLGMPELGQMVEFTRTAELKQGYYLSDGRIGGSLQSLIFHETMARRSNPARFTYFIREQALRLRVGDDQVMHEQMLHLVLVAALENVVLRVLPSGAGVRSAIGGAFDLMEFQESRPIVYLDNIGGGGLVIEEPGHVGRYRDILPMLAEMALGAEQSREFAARLADEYDRGSKRGSVAQEQLQRRFGNELRGGGVALSPTPIYE